MIDFKAKQGVVARALGSLSQRRFVRRDARSDFRTVQAERASQPGVLALFLTFSRISLSSFGGAMFWARRALVDRQRWLTEQEFVEFLALGQLLPGPNVLNLTVLVGYRFAGWAGAVASAAGFLGWPCLVVIGLGILHQQYSALPQMQRALAGMLPVAGGLLLANAIKNSTVLPRRWRPWLFGVLAFASVGILRWPLLWVVGALAPLAVATAWKERL